MQFVCNINMDTSAFVERDELQFLLKELSGKLGWWFNGQLTTKPLAGHIQDSNGNDVGYWEIQGTAQDDQDDERFTLTEAHRLDALQDNEKDKRAAEARGKTTRL